MSFTAPERAVYVDPTLETRSPEEIRARLTSLRETLASLNASCKNYQATIDELAADIADHDDAIVESDFLEPGDAADQHKHQVARAKAERDRHGLIHTLKELEPEIADLTDQIASLEAELARSEVSDA